MATVGILAVELIANTSKLSVGLDKGIAGLKSFAGSAKAVGKDLTTFVSLPIAGVGIAALKMATDFNASMANVATLIPGNVERVEELKKSVQVLAVETGKSTEDLSSGLFQVISAFGDSSESAELLGISAKAATAGLATTEESLNLLSAVTKGYGDVNAESVQKVSDLAFVTNKLGQTTFAELAGSIGRVVPLASELKVSQEELFGVMATATGVTGNAAEVSTQLRGVLQSLMAPTGDMADLFEQMGIRSGKALIKQHGLAGAMQIVVDAAKQSGEPLQKFIGSIEGQTLALALTGSQSEVFKEKLLAMNDVAGATQEAFLQQSEGVNKAGFTYGQLQQKLAVVSQRFGEALIPVMIKTLEMVDPLIEGLGSLIQWFGSLDAGVQATVGIFAAAFALGGPILVVVGAAISAIAAISAPILIGGAIVVGVIAGVGAIVANWEKIKKIPEIVKNMITGVKTWMVDSFQSMVVNPVKTKIESITGFFKGMFEAVVGGSFVPDMVNGIAAQFDRLASVMVKPAMDATQQVKGAFQGLAENAAVQNVWQEFISRTREAFNLSKTLSQVALEELSNAAIFAFGAIRTAFSNLVTSMIQGSTNFKNFLSDIWTIILNTIVTTLGQLAIQWALSTLFFQNQQATQATVFTATETAKTAIFGAQETARLGVAFTTQKAMLSLTIGAISAMTSTGTAAMGIMGAALAAVVGFMLAVAAAVASAPIIGQVLAGKIIVSATQASIAGAAAIAAGMAAIQVAAGTAVVAASTALSVPGFAEGGAVMGPTLATIGEKEPEIIAPFSKVQDMFGEKTQTIIVEMDGRAIMKKTIKHMPSIVRMQGVPV